MIDMATEFGQRVERRLRDEEVIWLVTVNGAGTPQPSPVWFLWDGSTILIYSQPNTPKLRNIAANKRVALHFNSDTDGDNIVVLTGDAAIQENGPLLTDVPAYVEKYRDGIAALGSTPEGMANEFRASVRVTPTKVRGH